MLPSAQCSLSRIPAVSPPLFPASGAAACGDSRISYQSPVTNHQSPQLCGDSLATRHSPLATSPVALLDCALTQKWGGVGGSLGFLKASVQRSARLVRRVMLRGARAALPSPRL